MQWLNGVYGASLNAIERDDGHVFGARYGSSPVTTDAYFLQVVRYIAGHKDFSTDVATILRWAARLSHVVLYAFLLAIPLVGWSVTSAHAVDLRLFGLVPLPALVAPDSDLADELTDYHAWLAYGLMGFVFVHALAALWHHYVLRDAVLVAMLPRPKRN